MESIADKVLELANKHFGDFKIRNGQVQTKYCPFCNGGENKDTYTFAVGLYNGMYNCARGKCCGALGDGRGTEGNFKQLANFFGEVGFEFTSLKALAGQKKKTYNRPNPDDIKPLTEEIITYMAKRCISKETLDDWKIGSDSKGNIVFPFYRDDKLIYVKYREPKYFPALEKEYEKKKASLPPEKAEKLRKPIKEWPLPNTEPILFGMDMVSYNKPLVITEGEIDALSLYEAGVTNVVSVPAGCKNVEWITLCWDWLENFQQIILFGDSDEPGMEMVSLLMKRLGEDRCMVAKEYPELIFNGTDHNRICKDANEILRCYGPEGLKAIVDTCEPVPIKGMLNLASVQIVDPATIPRIMTRIPALDNMIGGLTEGGVTVLTGKRGEGKSTLNGSLAMNAIEQGFKVCVYSGELNAPTFKQWAYLQATEDEYVGYCTDERSGKNITCLSKEIIERIDDYVDQKFWLFDNAYTAEEDQQKAILKVFEMCARRYGAKLFICDNLMMVVNSADEENKAQARFAAALKAFAVKYKVHVILVAHPRKTKAGETFTNDDVSGSSAITNLADTVISVEKPHLRVTKNRNFGTTGFIPCDYNPANRRIFQQSLGDRIVYSWDHNGIKKPENPAVSLEEFRLQSNDPLS